MIKKLGDWVRSPDAATAIEYGLIAAGIALVIAGTVSIFGDQVFDLFFEDLPNALEGGAP